MVGPSHDCTAIDQRCFHFILTDVLLSSEDRDEEWFERCQQVRVQTDQVGDKFEGVGGSLGPQMFKHQWVTLSQTHDGWRNSQDGFCIRTRTCEHGALSTMRQQMLDYGWISELELQFAGPSPSEPVFDFKENAASQWADEFDDHTGAQLPGELVHAGTAQTRSNCAHQVGCDRQGRPKQAKGEMQTCWKRAASEDEGNIARARTLQCDASVGKLPSVVGTSCWR